MILSETSSRKPSRIGFWFVLVLGALLLPFAPRFARTQASEQPKNGETKAQPAEKHIVTPSDVSKGIDFTDKPRVASVADHSEEIENQQDEIELLKVQVRLKEARIDATKKTLKEYERRLATYKQINQKQRGTIPVDTIMEVQLAVTNYEGQLQVNEAELQQSQIRLKQAERRLARLQRPAEKGDGGGRTQQEKRLRELEQKVEILLKEIHKLRKEMQPDGPRPATSSSN